MFYNDMPFADYLVHTQNLIKTHRHEGDLSGVNPSLILEANSPFELAPPHSFRQGKKYKTGALMIHGLLDSPFTYQEIGKHLQQNGVFCRSILLPGHGTNPNDLLSVSWKDWAKAVKYGIECLREEAEEIFLIGYSTGAALSIYHALQDSSITGLVLISPAIKLKTSIDMMIGWQHMIAAAGKNPDWICKEDELDYAKYKSIPFHPVFELTALTDEIENMHEKTPLSCPVWVVMSREDQTVSSQMAIEFFTTLPHPDNQFLLYTSHDNHYGDNRIKTRKVNYPDLHIEHFSHNAIPFSANNSHYGQHGDYVHASHIHMEDLAFGAYNHVEIDMYALLYKFGIIKNKRRELTYNPDFGFMMGEMVGFLTERK